MDDCYLVCDDKLLALTEQLAGIVKANVLVLYVVYFLLQIIFVGCISILCPNLKSKSK
jgi:hypothetical protein